MEKAVPTPAGRNHEEDDWRIRLVQITFRCVVDKLWTLDICAILLIYANLVSTHESL